MKKLFPDMPDVPQGVANRGVRIIEKHLRMHRVDRAKDLPEEAKVRLLRDLRAFFDSEMGEGSKGGAKTTEKGFWSRLWSRIQDFMSVCDNSTGAPAVLHVFSE
ncbi:MAG: hypothetical protein ABFD46_10950 [Armatimonadota bacterium]